MTQEILSSLEKNSNGQIKVIFVQAFDTTINRPSAVPFGAWATVGNEKSIIIIKEARSKSSEYARQDVGYDIWNSSYKEHYTLSNSQYDQLFGKNNWEKIWMDFADFQNWKNARELITDDDAIKRQEASWKSTGHR